MVVMIWGPPYFQVLTISTVVWLVSCIVWLAFFSGPLHSYLLTISAYFFRICFLFLLASFVLAVSHLSSCIGEWRLRALSHIRPWRSLLTFLGSYDWSSYRFIVSAWCIDNFDNFFLWQCASRIVLASETFSQRISPQSSPISLLLRH